MIGKTNIIARIEKAMPARVPMAKSNQKTSSGPSERKGRSPRMVDTMVRLIGVILREKALMYKLIASGPRAVSCRSLNLSKGRRD